MYHIHSDLFQVPSSSLFIILNHLSRLLFTLEDVQLGFMETFCKGVKASNLSGSGKGRKFFKI